MKYKLMLQKGLVLGEGSRAISIEKVNAENIYVRLQNDSQRRIIPSQLIIDLLPHLISGKISISDFSRKNRQEQELPHLFTFLDLDYENFLLGYEATISKLCEYELAQSQQGNSLLNVISVHLPKPFILLSGISGTGKTRFVKQQALKFKPDGSNYQLVPVRPDWHEPSDLLGYVSRLGVNGAEYIVTDFLVFLVSAWKEMVDRVDDGEISYKVDAVPFWLCLDEMNLAPVEQYFADYLSIIETRHWNEDQYSCEPLLNKSILAEYDSALRHSLELDDAEYDALWDYFVANGISIPPNLIVAGTVNMDETTHGFSRKVIDRAFTLDFGEFFPNDYSAYFEEKTQVKALSYPTLSRVNVDALADYDKDGSKSIAFLEAINLVLKTTPFELAYRALNELLLAVVCFQPQDENELQAVWDDFLMTKLLPRIEGDAEKLGDDGENSLLSQLNNVLEKELADIWNDQRIDLLREDKNGSALMVSCRSKSKIDWMLKRLDNNGFTSFWP